MRTSHTTRVLTLAAAGLAAACGADGETVLPDATPPPDGAVVDAGAPDARPFAHGELAAYQGPATCEGCHPGAIAEVMASVHYTFTRPLPADYVYDSAGVPVTQSTSGLFWRFAGLPGAWAQTNWLLGLRDDPATPAVDVVGGCGRCHVGIGLLPAVARGAAAPAVEEAEVNVDCLVCHAASYARTFTVATTGGAPDLDERGEPILLAVPRVDGVYDFSGQLAAARTVGPTSAATCQRCHALADGGGELFGATLHDDKRGVGFSAEADFHASHHIGCAVCHAGPSHTLERRRNADLWAYDGEPAAGLSCLAECHTRPVIHAQAVIEGHLDTVACTTCHARSRGGVVRRDFSVAACPPGGDCGAGGADVYGPTDERSPAGFRITYMWFDGTVEQPFRPRGGPGGAARIYPFKVATLRVPKDAAGATIPIAWSTLQTSGDVDAAIAAGRLAYAAFLDAFAGSPAAAGLPPTPGALDRWEETEAIYSVSHGMTADQALTCVDCHSATDPLLDWAGLGLTNPSPM